MHFGTSLTACRQEGIARKSLIGTINCKGRLDCFAKIWEDKLKGCADWPAQKLIDFSAEFEAIGIRRNTDITQERCENWRKWSAEAMENGAKTSFRYA